MGQHKHCRVCVNLQKTHSSGGDSRNWLLKKIDKSDFDPFQDAGTWLSKNEISNITFIFIREHRARYNRTIERIVAFKIQDGIIKKREDVRPGYTISSTCTFYRELDHIDLFDARRDYD